MFGTCVFFPSVFPYCFCLAKNYVIPSSVGDI
uniref:Uncharacterized protein n=1 Tax=Anguilla anguilla TaxID=7936 RepID=A0A0E9V1W0_ANGAN